MRSEIRKVFIIATVFAAIGIFTHASHAQSVPTTTVPSGFGRYCSVTYQNGTAGLAVLPQQSSDPCATLPGGTIQRAGLWSLAKNNNVLRNCSGEVGIYRGVGGTAIKQAYDEGAGKNNCIFTIAPTAIHVFNKPYFLIPGETDANPNVFDFNVYNKELNPVDFGQHVNPDCPHSHYIDRTGRQLCMNNGDWEQAYDWRLRKDTPIVSAAAGVVRAARFRNVSAFGCATSTQGEIYVEHKVGTGLYAEKFVTFYAHMSKILVKPGDVVTRGQAIGVAGATGCVSPPGMIHLHFAVYRTTNLSGHRWLDLTFAETGRGVSSIQGVIDPFGWDAPKHIDPWGWAFLGPQTDAYEGNITNPGAFSIYLWRSGQAPKTHE